jgi:transposase-like protein
MARRRSRQEWKQIVLEWQRSGLGKAQFARRHGLNPATFGFWCWTLKSELAAVPKRLKLLPVHALPPTRETEAKPRDQRTILDMTGGSLRLEFSLYADPRRIAELRSDTRSTTGRR